MKVALTWASPENPPGSAAQAIRGHVHGLARAGHEVALFYGERGFAKLTQAAADFDAVIWPSNLYNTRQLKDLDGIHRHFHLIGVDTPHNDVAFQEAIDAADTYSAVDPNCTDWFCQDFDLDPAEVAVIPNAPNVGLFNPSPHPDEGFALAPKSGAPQKEGTSLLRLAEETPNTRYETHTADPEKLKNHPFNLRIRPPLPWSRMPKRYQDCSFVVNPSRHEGLPNVAFEAFLSKRAYVCRPEAIGLIQTVPVDVIGDLEFGTAADWFTESYRELFDTGEHFVTSREDWTLIDAVRAVAGDGEKRDLVASLGRDWVETLAERWTWKDVGETMTEVIRDG